MTENQFNRALGVNIYPIAGTYAQHTISDTAVSLADLGVVIDSKCKFVDIQIEGAEVRYTKDGSTPTTDLGFIMIPVANDFLRLPEHQAKRIKFIKADTEDATVNVQQYQ